MHHHTLLAFTLLFCFLSAVRCTPHFSREQAQNLWNSLSDSERQVVFEVAVQSADPQDIVNGLQEQRREQGAEGPSSSQVTMDAADEDSDDDDDEESFSDENELSDEEEIESEASEGLSWDDWGVFEDVLNTMDEEQEEDDTLSEDVAEDDGVDVDEALDDAMNDIETDLTEEEEEDEESDAEDESANNQDEDSEIEVEESAEDLENVEDEEENSIEVEDDLKQTGEESDLDVFEAEEEKVNHVKVKSNKSNGRSRRSTGLWDWFTGKGSDNQEEDDEENDEMNGMENAGWSDWGNFEDEISEQQDWDPEYKEQDTGFWDEEAEEDMETELQNDAGEQYNEQQYATETEGISWAEDTLELSDIPGCMTLTRQGYRLLSCTGSDYEFHPSHIPIDVTHLIIQDSDVPELNEGHLENLVNLESLAIERCNLEHIERGAFRSLDSLTEVSFRSNVLSDIPSEAFLSGEDEYIPLAVLDLSDNLIQAIRSDDFSGIEDTLTQLSLRGNSFSSIDCEAFEDLVNLQILDLSKNELEQFPACIIAQLPNLQELSLKENYLTSISDDNFAACPHLTRIDLQKNAIESVSGGAFHNLPVLTTLELNGNNLQTIPQDALHEVHSSLVRLYLSDNPGITTVPSRAFDDFDLLEQLSLENCGLQQIEDEAFAGLHQLVELNLRYNTKLSVLKDTALPVDDLNNLSVLRLDHTNLTTVDEVMLEGLHDLINVTVNNIRLHCNCDVTWIKHAIDASDFEWARSWAVDDLYLDQYEIEYGGPTCDTPAHMNGRAIRDIDVDDLTCDPPTIIAQTPTEVVVNPGEDVTLQAEMTGGFPNGAWMLPNGDVIHPDQEVSTDGSIFYEYETMEGHAVISSLHITNFQPPLQGNYTLIAENADNAESLDFAILLAGEAIVSDPGSYFSDGNTDDIGYSEDNGGYPADDTGYASEGSYAEQAEEQDPYQSEELGYGEQDDQSIPGDNYLGEDPYAQQDQYDEQGQYIDQDQYGDQLPYEDQEQQNGEPDTNYYDDQEPFVEQNDYGVQENYDEQDVDSEGYEESGQMWNDDEFVEDDDDDQEYEEDGADTDGYGNSFDDLFGNDPNQYNTNIDEQQYYGEPNVEDQNMMHAGYGNDEHYQDIDDFEAEQLEEEYLSREFEERNTIERESTMKTTLNIGFAVLGLAIGMIVLAVGYVFYSRSKTPGYYTSSEYRKLKESDLNMYGTDVFVDEEEDM